MARIHIRHTNFKLKSDERVLLNSIGIVCSAEVTLRVQWLTANL